MLSRKIFEGWHRNETFHSEPNSWMVKPLFSSPVRQIQSHRMHRLLQFDKRENPASDRRYGSRSAVTMEPPPNAIGKDRSSTTTAGTIIDDAPIESHIPTHAAANRAATGEKDRK